LRRIKVFPKGSQQIDIMVGIRLLSIGAFWLCMTAGAGAYSLDVSAHPGKQPVSAAHLSKSDREKVGELFMVMCLNHFAEGRFELAEQACGRAIEADSHLADAYKLRGYAYLMDHRFERAEKDFRSALKLKPNDDQNIAGYGQSLNGESHFSDAASQFHRALSLAPERAAYWNGLCWALAGEGHQLYSALDTCNRALALAPGAAGILNSRAMVYLRLRRFPLAVADYSASLEVQHDQASAWFGRGLARLWLGEKEGSSDISEARRRDPGVGSIFIQMSVLPARCLNAKGPACPPDFPIMPEKSSGAYQVAMLHADPDQELFSEIKVREGHGGK
jgi:Flp pilus assembly protein TadD